MPRKSGPAVVQHDDVNTTEFEQGATSLVEVSGNASRVAQMIGYDLVYNRENVIHMFNFHASNAAESMLHMGRHLILLKENEPHGEFMEIVHERLGLNIRTAQRMMQASVKFMGLSPEANASLVTHLGKTKLFVLMNEDDSALEALAEGGTLAGVTLDEMQCMTRDELEAALRDERENAKAKDELLATRSATIDRLQTKHAKVKPSTPDEEAAQLRRETSDYAHTAEAIIRGSLRDGLEQLARHAEQTGASHEEFSAGVLAQVQRAVAELRGQLGIKAAPDGDPTPEWMKEA